MAKKKNRSWTASQAGNKTAARAQQSPSWSLKTRCRELTVLDYIRLVCEDNLAVLVASGRPLDKDLETARADVLTEFAELSGSGESEAHALYKAIEGYRENIFAATTALSIFDGYFDKELRDRACAVLDKCGISTRAWGEEVKESDLKRAVAEIKAIDSRMALKVKEYNKLAAQNKGKKITEADVRREMAILSSTAGFAITHNCNLADYAQYKHIHLGQMKALEIAQSKLKK